MARKTSRPVLYSLIATKGEFKLQLHFTDSHVCSDTGRTLRRDGFETLMNTDGYTICQSVEEAMEIVNTLVR